VSLALVLALSVGSLALALKKHFFGALPAVSLALVLALCLKCLLTSLGHTTLENEPHINSFVGQGDGYDMMCKASASSKIFPCTRINQSTGNSSTNV